MYNQNNHYRHQARWAKKPQPKRPNFIYKDDACFFSEPHEVFPANDKWDYKDCFLRVIWPGEPLVYMGKSRTRTGMIQHHLESHGLKYVFVGSIKAFTKSQVQYQEGWTHEDDFRKD